MMQDLETPLHNFLHVNIFSYSWKRFDQFIATNKSYVVVVDCVWRQSNVIAHVLAVEIGTQAKQPFLELIDATKL
jgi:hypothetical protein